ncbi:helix-turn-helix transcriptional regulator [Pontibacter sp. BT731]|uniref:helix-turn-helix domain-containing protein n=1 Tax=Pontibacter coccineus TaxID=3063328 RepID=UPI0026E1884A|nr:helix-turn-helix transcriptional regulator [Pontibacter sp. BT731]MDO6392070.1 helix-turn-helix transcriptional regulator [Pontibacter sp. BT731]
MESSSETSFLKAFGHHLKRLRQERGLTQANLAFEAGLSESQVQRIEYGNHNFTIMTLISLAKALELHPSQLLVFFPEIVPPAK